MASLEIERKFLMNVFPMDLPMRRQYILYQGYLSIDPEVRIRKQELDQGVFLYYLTIKSSGGLVREEIEFLIGEEKYEPLKQMIPHPFIKKECKEFFLPGGLLLECSHVDSGTPTAFFYGEVEFPDEESARQFQPLPCFCEEVTDDSRYKMKNYWKRTRLGG